MSLVVVACVLGLVLVEGMVLRWCLGRHTRISIKDTLTVRIGRLVVAQLLIVVVFVSGSALDGPLHHLSQRVFAKSHVVAGEHFEIGGDPRLLRFVDRRPPAIARPVFGDPEAFRAWQQSLRRELRRVFQLSDVGLSTRVDVRKAQSVVLVPDIERTALTLESFDGTHIPAYLFTPARTRKRPAVLVLHGHVPERSGGIAQTAGTVDSYQHGAALELARAGYVTLTIEFRGFGYLGAGIGTEHRLVAYNAILGGSFYKAVVSKDIKAAVDFLLSLDDVDPRRIGITGVSYGGEMAVTYAALDERIAVVVPQGFGGQVGRQEGVVGTRHDQPHYCHIIPGVNTFMQQEDVFLLIAPRPLLSVWGDQGYAGRVHPVFSSTVRQAYDVFHVGSSVEFRVVEGRHEYFVEPAIEFFDRFL